MALPSMRNDLAEWPSSLIQSKTSLNWIFYLMAGYALSPGRHNEIQNTDEIYCGATKTIVVFLRVTLVLALTDFTVAA